VFAKGFEDTPLPDNFFDAVIGNIPFGNYAVHDPAYRRTPALTRTIHDYFLAKSMDKVRPGGVLALITSRYTMDKQDAAIRTHLAERADLVGAIRLPNTTFKANAGTEVTTDILFLQKRAPGAPANGESWRDLAAIETQDGPVSINEYFVRHPEMMLGTMRLERGLYSAREPTLAGEFSAERLATAVAITSNRRLPQFRRTSFHARHYPGRERRNRDREGRCLCRARRRIVVRSGAELRSHSIFRNPLQRACAECLQVRDTVRLVFQTQLNDEAEDRILEARQLLNRAYDNFVWRHGPLSSKENVKAFAGDPDHPLLLSLETYDPDTKRATKTAIFERRTLERYKPRRACRNRRRGPRHFAQRNRRDQLAAHGTGDGPASRPAARTWQPRLSQSRGRTLGDRRSAI
jgi:hypothetical protein